MPATWGEGGRHLSKGRHVPPPQQAGDQFGSVAQSCPTLFDPIDCSMPSFPVHHQLLKLTHTQVRRVGDAVQPSHPLHPLPLILSVYYLCTF